MLHFVQYWMLKLNLRQHKCSSWALKWNTFVVDVSYSQIFNISTKYVQSFISIISTSHHLYFLRWIIKHSYSGKYKALVSKRVPVRRTRGVHSTLYIKRQIVWTFILFFAFDFCRFCVVIRVFFKTATTAKYLGLRRISIPELIHYFLSYLNFLASITMF